jgi:hypothetical protein
MPRNTERVSGLDPGSSFYGQLQKLLSPNSKPSYQFLPFAIAPRVTSPSPTFDLQHVADSPTPETDVSSSIETDTTECISSSDLLQTLYIPHGKWEWARDHSIVDEQSRFLSCKSTIDVTTMVDLFTFVQLELCVRLFSR